MPLGINKFLNRSPTCRLFLRYGLEYLPLLECMDTIFAGYINSNNFCINKIIAFLQCYNILENIIINSRNHSFYPNSFLINHLSTEKW